MDYPQSTWFRSFRAALPYTVEYTALAVGSLLLPELRVHARVTDPEEDRLLMRYGNAAGRRLESDTRRVLLTTTMKEHYDVWPWDYLPVVQLHYAPVASLTSVKYYDTDDAQQTWSSANYESEVLGEPARIVLAEGATDTSPSIDQRLHAVTIQYEAGYGATLANLPDVAVVAMCQYATYLFDCARDVSPVYDATAVERTWQAATRELLWQAE